MSILGAPLCSLRPNINHVWGHLNIISNIDHLWTIYYPPSHHPHIGFLRYQKRPYEMQEDIQKRYIVIINKKPPDLSNKLLAQTVFKFQMITLQPKMHSVVMDQVHRQQGLSTIPILSHCQHQSKNKSGSLQCSGPGQVTMPFLGGFLVFLTKLLFL